MFFFRFTISNSNYNVFSNLFNNSFFGYFFFFFFSNHIFLSIHSFLCFTQYPEWLEEQKGKLSEEEYKQREKQYEILCQVCGIYESETCNQRLGEILVLVESMGQMPEELVNSTSGFDQGVECSIM